MSELSIPIGRAEDQRLEFKGADALARPHRIGREVVAMLNSGGGEVWIGLGEGDGRAIELQSIPDVRRQAERLRDSLLDSISPPIRESEVRIDEVLVEGMSGVLRIVVSPAEKRGPYGLTQGPNWLFPRRVGSRIRSLSLDELGEMFRHGRGPTGDEAAMALRRELDVLREKGRDILWVRLQPEPPLRLDLTAVRDGDFLTDPRVTGNRAIGKSFTNAAVLGGERPRLKTGSVSIGREGIFFVTVFRHGGLLFEAPLTTLFTGGREPELDAEALMEYPTSILRLCATLLAAPGVFEEGTPAPGTEIVAALALLGVGGWRLRPGSPRRTWTGWVPQPKALEEQDLVFAQPPLRFRSDDVRERPDECAFRLWSQVYEAFGFWPEDYPPEYDTTSGLLVLPR